MKKEPRSDERFVTRCAIADNILRYSFRLDRPDLSKRPKKEDALIDWAVKEAYAMFEPLVGDRIAKPFGVGCLPPLYGKEAVQNFLGENAIAQLYCQLREIIGEENPVSAYEAVKYTYFGSKEKSSEKGIVTGMDYLIQNNVYTFQTGSMALNKKSELDTFEFQDKEEVKLLKEKTIDLIDKIPDKHLERTYKFVKCVSEMSSKRFALLEKLTGSDMKPDIAEEKAYEVSRMSEEEVEQELAKLN